MKTWTEHQVSQNTRKKNLILLMNPPVSAWDASVKGGKMIINRFCIDENAGFELSGVTCLKKRHQFVVTFHVCEKMALHIISLMHK